MGADTDIYHVCYWYNTVIVAYNPVLLTVVGTWPESFRLSVQLTEIGTKATFCHDMLTYLHHNIKEN